MPRRRRAAAVLKWSGVGVCAVIFGVWFGSRWFIASGSYAGSNANSVAFVGSGRVELARFLSDDAAYLGAPPGWNFAWGAAKYPRWGWQPELLSSPGPLVSGQVLAIPLYLPFVVLALATVWLFHRDRRIARWAKSGRCAKCGYDLSGLRPGAACPECGKGGSA